MRNTTDHKIKTGATYLRDGEHTYANMNRTELKQRKAVMYPGKKKLKLIILVLAVLLILMFCIVIILTSLLIIYKTEMTENESQYNERSCDSGWLQFEDSCYLLTSSRSNWTTAQSACERLQSNLAIITSRKEQVFLNYQMSERHYWIGLTDVETENKFKWVDGTTLSLTSFSNWGNGNPDNKNDEDCVQLRDCGRWNDAQCSGVNYAICEKSL
ncbi:CD209 antigen-like protein C isoform X2 [Pseudophryne corroboree]|uniref:CD209 antigen-like protein C isoform X2 n=1 Tax=Pseudophryne corroboree TaxID=495146 RepID=UPI0030817F35